MDAPAPTSGTCSTHPVHGIPNVPQSSAPPHPVPEDAQKRPRNSPPGTRGGTDR